MYSAHTSYHTSETCASTYRAQFKAVNYLQYKVEKYIVTTSKLPAASTLYTKGMLLAMVAIKAIKALPG